MPNNTGFLLLGLGALLFLGRGGAVKPDEDNRLVTGQGRGLPMPPAFDIQSYIEGLFRDTATVPVQPPMQFFFPRAQVVTSSGVPAVVNTAPSIITPTTKVQIGGAGGETITASSLAIIRSEQIAKQEFAASTNSSLRTSPEGEQYFYEATVAANLIEEARQKKFAADLIAKNRAAQAATRLEQENVAAGMNPDGSLPAVPAGMSIISDYRPPTINYSRETAEDDEGLSFSSTAGQSITVSADTEFIDVDFTPDYSQTFVLSGGMDSPTVYASEDEQPSGVTVSMYDAQYEIGF